MLQPFLNILTYFVPVMIMLIIMLLLFTVIQAKRTVSKRYEINSDVDDHYNYPMNKDGDSEEDSEMESRHSKPNSVSAEFSERYSYISPEYMDKNFQKQILDCRRESSSASSSRSRSNSQVAIDALSRQMFSKSTESDKGMEVLDAVDVMEGNDVYDLDDMENRRTSWPQQSLKKRSSMRLRSLQNIQE